MIKPPTKSEAVTVSLPFEILSEGIFSRTSKEIDRSVSSIELEVIKSLASANRLPPRMHIKSEHHGEIFVSFWPDHQSESWRKHLLRWQQSLLFTIPKDRELGIVNVTSEIVDYVV